MKTERIYIHHDGALGDTLLSLPSIDIIRETASQLHLSGRVDVVHFLKEAGIADEVSSTDSGFYASLYTESPDKRLISWLSGFDRSYIFTVNPDSLPVKNLMQVLPGSRVIMTIPPPQNIVHVAEFRLKQIGSANSAGICWPTIRITEEAMQWTDSLWAKTIDASVRQVIVLHPGSGGKQKRWPVENFAQLIRHAATTRELAFIVCTGPAEDDDTMTHYPACSRQIIHLRQASLMQVAAVLVRSDFYIGNDSGISHLAGILGCQGAVLFGPSDPVLWRPLGHTLDVVRFAGQGAVPTFDIIDRLIMISRRNLDNSRA